MPPLPPFIAVATFTGTQEFLTHFFCSSLDTSFRVRSTNESHGDETHTDGYVITTGCNYNVGNNRWNMSVSIERNVNKVRCNVM